MSKKAKTKGAEDAISPSVKKARLMTLLNRISFVLHLIAITGLFAGIFDFGVINLVPVLAKYAGIFLILEIVAIVLQTLTSGQIVAAQRGISDEKFDAMKTGLEERMAFVGDKVEEYLGENYQRLMGENETMKTEFEQIRENANNKILAEIEELKVENADLRKKLESRFTNNDTVENEEDQLQVA